MRSVGYNKYIYHIARTYNETCICSSSPPRMPPINPRLFTRMWPSSPTRMIWNRCRTKNTWRAFRSWSRSGCSFVFRGSWNWRHWATLGGERRSGKGARGAYHDARWSGTWCTVPDGGWGETTLVLCLEDLLWLFDKQNVTASISGNVFSLSEKIIWFIVTIPVLLGMCLVCLKN